MDFSSRRVHEVVTRRAPTALSAATLRHPSLRTSGAVAKGRVTSTSLDRGHVGGGGDGDTHPPYGVHRAVVHPLVLDHHRSMHTRRPLTARWSGAPAKHPPSTTCGTPMRTPFRALCSSAQDRHDLQCPNQNAFAPRTPDASANPGLDQREMFLPATGDKIGGKQRRRQSRQPDRGNADFWHPGVPVTEQARLGRIHFRCGRGRGRGVAARLSGCPIGEHAETT